MSTGAVAEALCQKISNSPAKLVLISLADHHNKSTGKCCPSIRTLTEDASKSRETIFRCLNWLETNGFIRRLRVFDVNGRQTSNDYELLFLARKWGCQDDTGEGVTSDTGEGVTSDTPLKGTVRRNRKKEMKMPNKPEDAYSPSSSHRERTALKAKAKEIKASQKAANAERRSKAQPDLPDMPDDVNAAKEAERAFEDAVVQRFNAIAPKHKIAPALRLTSQRRQTLRVLIKSGFDVNAALDALERAAFPTKNGWTPENFDSVFREQTITQLIEGKFDGGKRQVVETADEMRWRHYMRTWIKYMNMPVAQRTNPATGVYLAWESVRGPEPFQPGCRVPDYILAEFQRPNSAPVVSFDDMNAKRWRQRIVTWIDRGRVLWPESWGQMRDIPEEIRREFPNEIFDDEKPANITKNGGVK